MTLKELGQIRDALTLIKMGLLKSGLGSADIKIRTEDTYVCIQIIISLPIKESSK